MEKLDNVEMTEEELDNVTGGQKTATPEWLKGGRIGRPLEEYPYPVQFSIDTAFKRLDRRFFPV